MPDIRVLLGDNEVHRCTFDKDVVSIGRSRDNDVVIENLAVSRNHARLRRNEDGRYILSDLNSANGTILNGETIAKSPIKNGDVITIGKYRLVFEDNRIADEELIGDAFGADRTMIVERVPDARLRVVKGKQKNQEFRLTKYETTLGRDADNDVRIHDWFVARRHAVILRQGERFFIKDAGSWKGTFVNGQKAREAPLASGDEVRVGITTLRFTVEDEQQRVALSGPGPRRMLVGPEAAPEAALDAAVAGGGATGATADAASPEEQTAQAAAASAQGPGEADPRAEAEPPPDPERRAHEIRLWERALSSRSEAVRREAARMLKKLTERDYDL